MKHVDDWMDDAVMGDDDNAKYAAFFLHLKRLSAVYKMAFEPYIKDFKLFCVYENKTYRVTGASRLGDVWLTQDFSRDIGYDLRVDISMCSNWRKEP